MSCTYTYTIIQFTHNIVWVFTINVDSIVSRLWFISNVVSWRSYKYRNVSVRGIACIMLNKKFVWQTDIVQTNSK